MWVSYTNAWKNHPRADQTEHWKHAKALPIRKVIESVAQRPAAIRSGRVIEFNPIKQGVMPIVFHPHGWIESKQMVELVDYAATKGAIVAFTRSLALQLVKRGIRVNGVAPGPVWTPLIPSTFDAGKVARFGLDVPMERAGEPEEIAPSYFFLASTDSSFMTGQILHPNGGEVVNA